jgi:hypothetical protein
MTAPDFYTNEQQKRSRYCLQYKRQYIKPNKDHIDSWNEVEKEQVKDWMTKLKELKDGPDSLSKALWQFAMARAVITLLDGRHRYTVTRSACIRMTCWFLCNFFRFDYRRRLY